MAVFVEVGVTELVEGNVMEVLSDLPDLEGVEEAFGLPELALIMAFEEVGKVETPERMEVDDTIAVDLEELR